MLKDPDPWPALAPTLPRLGKAEDAGNEVPRQKRLNFALQRNLRYSQTEAFKQLADSLLSLLRSGFGVALPSLPSSFSC